MSQAFHVAWNWDMTCKLGLSGCVVVQAYLTVNGHEELYRGLERRVNMHMHRNHAVVHTIHTGSGGLHH